MKNPPDFVIEPRPLLYDDEAGVERLAAALHTRYCDTHDVRYHWEDARAIIEALRG